MKFDKIKLTRLLQYIFLIYIFNNLFFKKEKKFSKIV